ncbi:MAG: M3 family oligoendopeptidase [Lachnospiraceae bacterium]|mgnify:FL=1|nr:M3 family oligoendopeptidase [Lachnospiraceae bacterium]
MKFKDMPYKRVDMEAAKQELATIMKEFEAAKTAQEQLEVHKRYYALSERMQTQMTIASIRHSIDTSDEFYEAEKTYYDQEGPAFDNLAVQYKKMLYASLFREEIEKVIGGPAIRNIELASKAVSEEIIPLMQEENALVTEYEKLLASASIDWEGETLNLSTIIPYLNNKDRDIRRKAAAKANEFYKSIEEQLDELYDKLVKNRTQQAQKLGFETYTELGYCRMQRNSYWREEVERFRAQVKKDWVPFAEEMWENRRVRLGLDSMYHMDEGVSFPNGTPTPTGTPEEILKSGQEMYEELSSETKEFFDFMMDGDLFDVFSRPHKQVGGYMTYLPDYHAPFIFANFNGTAGDVDVVTHECGHAFQGYLAGKDPILEHADITMDTAETHSMSMEFFTNPWMEKFFGSRASDFLKSQLEDAVVFIPYGSMVDEFQHIVYDNPNLTPAQRKEAWKKLEAEYKPHMKYEEESSFFAEGGFWQRQHHIYSFPFYYIDYAIAQTDAFQYKIWMQKDYHAAWESYLAFCKSSASDFFTNTVKAAGLDSPFEEGTIGKIVEGLREIYKKM